MNELPVLTVLTDDVVPPYEQLRRQLAGLIGTGVLVPGQRLPSLRQLARDLGLAVGTVARSYRELEASGLIATRHGAGTRVSESPPPVSDAYRRRQLAAHALDYLVQARLLGAGDDAILGAVAQAIGRPGVPVAAPAPASG